MTANGMQECLCDVLTAMTFIDPEADEQITVPDELLDEDQGVNSVSTFAQAGVLTRDAGIVIRMRDGREFQLTIVQSR